VSLSWSVVILAAGKGTRMKSDLPKVMHPLRGRPLLDHVLDTALALVPPERVVVVVGHGARTVGEAARRRGAATVLQEPQLGTGDAVRTALAAPVVSRADALLVLSGDVPLLRPATLDGLRRSVERGADAALLSAVLDDPGSYGRVVRTADGSAATIVEARDAGPAELAITEVNAGVYAFRRRPLARALAGLDNDNDQREYYLTDVVAALRADGRRVAVTVLDDPEEMLGVNTVADLARLEAILAARPRAG